MTTLEQLPDHHAGECLAGHQVASAASSSIERPAELRSANTNYFADVSSHNGALNIATYAMAKPVALMIKATESTNYRNPYYLAQVEACRHHNIAVFHYHFARPEHGQPHAEIDFFWQTVGPHFSRPGDYVVFDVETGPYSEMRAWLLAADKRMHAISDTKPRCYSSADYITAADLQLASNSFHVASWGVSLPGGPHWRLDGREVFGWQFTDGKHGGQPHSMPGIGQCDISLLNPAYANRLRQQKGWPH